MRRGCVQALGAAAVLADLVEKQGEGFQHHNVTRLQPQRALKKSLRAITLAAAAAVLLLAAGLGAATLASSSNRAAVVIAKEAVVRFGPLEESQVASQLPDGVEVLVLDEKANWLEIRDATGRTGWLKRDQVKQL